MLVVTAQPFHRVKFNARSALREECRTHNYSDSEFRIRRERQILENKRTSCDEPFVMRIAERIRAALLSDIIFIC